MGYGFSKPVPKPSEPTLPRSTSRTVKYESFDTGRIESRSESAEYHAFRKCFADLAGASGILDPGWLADQLFSRELIGPDLRKAAHNQAVEGREKIGRLLSAVQDQIVASPAIKFREFVDVLQNDSSLQHLATRLENTYRELSGLCTPSVSPPMSTRPSGPPLTLSSPHPQHPTPNFSPPAKPSTDILQTQHTLEHSMPQFDFQRDHLPSPRRPSLVDSEHEGKHSKGVCMTFVSLIPRLLQLALVSKHEGLGNFILCSGHQVETEGRCMGSNA